MITFHRRYRWWLLLLVAVAGLASWCFWPNAMRKRYGRIQLDMTSAEVDEIMGRSGNIVSRDGFFESLALDGARWKTITNEGVPRRQVIARQSGATTTLTSALLILTSALLIRMEKPSTRLWRSA